ncbi:carbonic anhydrase [Nannocystis pusilla]|uniref:Carbonic anhydrase n=1 Tax=Nannocystis pusilla TaxID=889268 RepID=A0ABS7TKT3_9BACT|nr:carbonic anhydrase [Nannocystis pusilla]MBZ5708824.1 carbonic anhydrase [Nannocystis pusilla]
MTKQIVPPLEALRRLIAGNERYSNDTRSVQVLASQLSREDLVAGQSPFAIVLSCSDSRAPAEILFDQGVGDLFVIRVAGNIVAPSIVGSAEFAAATFGTRLLVVMGHSGCGAVRATLDVLHGVGEIGSDNLRDIVDRIRPIAQTVIELAGGRSREEELAEAIRANVRQAVAQLCHGSRILEDLVRSGELVIVGATYDIASGRVDFFGVPEELRAALSAPRRAS